MDELFKMLDELFEKGLDTSKDTVKEDAEADIKDFKSLVSKEELEAIDKVKEALENLVDVHNKHVITNLVEQVKKSTPKQKVHYSIFTEVIDDTIKNVNVLSTINTEGVKALEEAVKDCNTTYEEVMKSRLIKAILNQ